MSAEKQTILITGCSSGIGFQIATIAAEHGHTIVATAPTEALLADVPETAAMKLVLDVTDAASIAAAVKAAEEQLGSLTSLGNNAGYCQTGPVELIDDARLRKQFDVNVFGAMAVARAVIPSLRRGGGGRIVNLSSMFGQVTVPYHGVYCASKYAIEALSDALRMELKEFGIDVVLIEPGWIKTPFLKTANSLIPDEWQQEGVYATKFKRFLERSVEMDEKGGKVADALMGTPEQVAGIVVRALEAKRPSERYPVTAMAKLLPLMQKMMPTGLWDTMQNKSLGA